MKKVDNIRKKTTYLPKRPDESNKFEKESDYIIKHIAVKNRILEERSFMKMIIIFRYPWKLNVCLLIITLNF